MPTNNVNHFNVDVPNTAALLSASALGPGALLLVESATTQTGAYAQIAAISLVAGTSVYPVWDLVGAVTQWYRTRLSNSGATAYTAYGPTFQTAFTAYSAPSAAPTVVPVQYCTLDDIRTRLAGDVPNMDASFDAQITALIVDVSDGINSEVQAMRAQPEGWSFVASTTPVTRRYTGYPGGTDFLLIDDAVSVTSVVLLDQQGNLQQTLVLGQDYLPWPLNTLPIIGLKALVGSAGSTWNGYWPQWYGGIQITMITGYGLVVPPDLHDVAVTETIRAYESARAGENDAVGVGPLGTIVVSKAFTDKSRRILNRYSNRMGWFR